MRRVVGSALALVGVVPRCEFVSRVVAPDDVYFHHVAALDLPAIANVASHSASVAGRAAHRVEALHAANAVLGVLLATAPGPSEAELRAARDVLRMVLADGVEAARDEHCREAIAHCRRLLHPFLEKLEV